MNERHDTTRLLTTKELAAALGMSVRTLQRHLKRHAIRHDSVTAGQIREKRYTAATLTYLRQQITETPNATDDATTDSQRDTTPALLRHDNDATDVVTALVASFATERRAWQAERDDLLTRALHAEWEAAQLRPLPALPDITPAPRRRWWCGRRG